VKTLKPKVAINSTNCQASEVERTLSAEKAKGGTDSNPFLPLPAIKRQTSSPLLPLPKYPIELPNEDPFAALNPGGEKIGFKSFKIIKVLGSGAFGKVFMVRNRTHAYKFAH
jgi:hypothetical protein